MGPIPTGGPLWRSVEWAVFLEDQRATKCDNFVIRGANGTNHSTLSSQTLVCPSGWLSRFRVFDRNEPISLIYGTATLLDLSKGITRVCAFVVRGHNSDNNLANLQFTMTRTICLRHSNTKVHWPCM